MRILFVSPTGSFFSGAEVSIVNLMTYLSQQGHTIFNVIPDNGVNKDSDYLEKMAVFDITVHQLPQLGWWWQESDNYRMFPKKAINAFQHKAIFEIRRLLVTEEIDLVISNTVNVFQGAIAAACERVPHFYLIHEFPEGEFSYYREKIELITHLSSKIFAVSGHLYEVLQAYFPQDKLLPFVPYTHVTARELQQGEKTRIVSVGGIIDRKNQLELIKAYHQLNDETLELVFIGGWDDEYKKICDDYILENQLQNVSFLGHQKDPWSYLTDKDIVVFPSKMEAFPMVYVEALLNGLPVIVSDNGGHLSVYKAFDAGTVYELGNVEELTAKLSAALDQFSCQKEAAEQAKARIRESYTLPKVSQPFLDQLERLEQKTSSDLFASMASFWGLELAKEWLDRLKWEQVTIFFGDEQGVFSPSRSLVLPLEDEGSFEIQLSNEPQLRIDLSEFPAAFTDVSLRSKTYNVVLEPSIRSGLMESRELLFVDRDPQLIYDTRPYANDTLTFSYRKLSFDDLPRQLAAIVERQRQTHLSEMSHKEEAYKALQESYQQLHTDYHSVIGSRRWLLTTKLINFLKRKRP